jgi:hypothetical protein
VHPDPTDITFVFQLSARIDPRFSHSLPPTTEIVSVEIDHPRTSWLRDSRQLQDLGAVARQVFEDCMNELPGAERWHILYGGPAPGAVIVGQQLNPTMTPPVQLYEYQRPNHLPSILIGAQDLTREVKSHRLSGRHLPDRIGFTYPLPKPTK